MIMYFDRWYVSPDLRKTKSIAREFISFGRAHRYDWRRTCSSSRACRPADHTAVVDPAAASSRRPDTGWAAHSGRPLGRDRISWPPTAFGLSLWLLWTEDWELWWWMAFDQRVTWPPPNGRQVGRDKGKPNRGTIFACL